MAKKKATKELKLRKLDHRLRVARCATTGQLKLWVGKPIPMVRSTSGKEIDLTGKFQNYLPDEMFPDLKPGEECLVAIVPLSTPVVRAAKHLLSLRTGDGISQESVCMGQELARHIVQTRS